MADQPSEGLAVDETGITRCSWSGSDPLYVGYHDAEWGLPVADDQQLLEKLCLEGFQAGLSWLTVLRKRPAFREAFASFDPVIVSSFGDDDVERLLGDAAIIRHRAKIESAINNARRTLDVQQEFGSLASYVWRFEPPRRRRPPRSGDIPASTAESTAFSKDLKRRGWSFVGPTTVYAFMQARGLVNDHLNGCVCWERVEAARADFAIPAGGGD
jgi:DNA-3-methyladenine glycosylase I